MSDDREDWSAFRKAFNEVEPEVNTVIAITQLMSLCRDHQCEEWPQTMYLLHDRLEETAKRLQAAQEAADDAARRVGQAAMKATDDGTGAHETKAAELLDQCLEARWDWIAAGLSASSLEDEQTLQAPHDHRWDALADELMGLDGSVPAVELAQMAHASIFSNGPLDSDTGDRFDFQAEKAKHGNGALGDLILDRMTRLAASCAGSAVVAVLNKHSALARKGQIAAE